MMLINSTLFMEKYSDLVFFRGRVALYSVLSALDINEGDQVAIQAFTCIAVPEAIFACGATPLYVDTSPQSVNMDSDDLEKKITANTKAIVVQHTFGIPAELDKIISIAKKHNIPIIEDCCHTLSSTYHGQIVGSFGIASFYSFEWGKPLVAGMGGILKVNNSDLQEKLEDNYNNFQYPRFTTELKLNLQYLAYQFLLRPSWYWQLRSFYHLLSRFGTIKGSYNPTGYDVQGIAEDFSLRMPTSTQKRLTDKLKSNHQNKQDLSWIVEQYKARITSSSVQQISVPSNASVVYSRYPLICVNKQKVLETAKQINIEIADWYTTPVHPLAKEKWHLVNYKADSCPNAEKMALSIISLPINSKVTQKDIDKIIKVIDYH